MRSPGEGSGQKHKKALENSQAQKTGERSVPGQYIKTYQAQVYMRAREIGCTQSESATIAGFSERSGRRIEQGDHQPQYGQARNWRTRTDPLAEVWDNELEPMLRKEPRLEPTTLYEYLVGKYPGQYELSRVNYLA